MKDLEQDAKRLRMEQKKLVGLLDLPHGPLHLIFSKVPLETQKLLRNVSEEIREEHNEFVMHNFKSLSHHIRNLEESDMKTLKLNILKVMENATNYLVNSGYVSCFINSLSLIFRGKDDVHVENMQRLLYMCYHLLEWSPCESPNGGASHVLLHRRRLVIMVTLLNLLRHFRGYRKVSSHMNLMHWQLHIELKGIYIIDAGLDNWEEDKLVDLMTLISELLVYDMSESTSDSNFVIEIGTNVYNYGVRKQMAKRGTRLDLKFSILAPLVLRNLMEDALAGNVDQSTAVTCPLLDSFSIHLDLNNIGVNSSNKTNWEIYILPLL